MQGPGAPGNVQKSRPLSPLGLVEVFAAPRLGRFMGTSSQNYESAYNLLRGLRGLTSALILGVISTLNLQVGFRAQGSGFTGMASAPFNVEGWPQAPCAGLLKEPGRQQWQ